jgi:F420-dependent oxidoreductase-like protein
MKLGTTVSVFGPGAADRVRTLEAAGIEAFWVAELYSFDGVSQMGYLAAITEKAQIGSSILPFYSRTPTLLAMTAAGIDALSGGRCILGIGASGPQVIEGWHGVAYDRPVERVREIVDVCRKVWRREVVTHDGPAYTIPLPPEQGTGLGKPLKLINHPVRPNIPIYVASIGPKNVEMTAEICEGWIPIFFWPEKYKDVWGKAISRGSAKRDPELGPLEVVAGASVAIGEGLEGLRERGRGGLALYIGGMGARGRNFYNDLAKRYGFEQEAVEIQDLYLDGKREEAAAKVPADLLEGTSLIGPAGYVKERLAAFKEAGVTTLNVNIGGPEPEKTIEQLRGMID